MAQPPPRSPFPGFRVIIIGAGPAGLSAAHGLALAGIDFLLLERRAGSVVGQDDVGASLVLSPASVRVMQQFGIADRLVHGSGSGSGCGEDGQRGVAAASRGGTEMEENFVLDAKGRVVSRTETARIFKQCHGIGQLALHRAELVRALYEGLSAESRSKILLGQHITDIQQNHGGDDNDVSGGGGVRVTCADGTVHTGSIVIGADGVNSFARAAMRRLALADWRQKKKEKKKRAADKGEEEKKSKDGSAASTAPGSSDTHDDHDDDDDQGLDWDPEDPFPAEYVCLWATLPPPPSSSPDPNPAAVPAASTTSSSSSSPWAGMSCNTHDAGRSTMHVAGKDRSWVFLFEKLAGTTAAAAAAAGGPTRDNKMRYTEHDMRAMAERFGEYHITPPGWAGDGSGGGGAGKGMKIKDAFAAAAQAEDDQGQQHGTPLPAAPKMRWGMTILGEGVARNWHYSGLVVLVGDACHKFTPNAGQGFNTGLQDVVALCNLLRGALAAAAAAAAAAAGQEASGQEEEEGTKPRDEASHPVITGEPTRTETPAGQAPMPTPTRTPLLLLLPQHALEALFREYHVSRRDEAASMQQMSASYTRIQAVASLGWRLVGWLLGGEAVQGLLIRWLIAPQLARSLVLDYVPFEDRYVGSVPWAMTCTGGSGEVRMKGGLSLLGGGSQPG